MRIGSYQVFNRLVAVLTGILIENVIEHRNAHIYAWAVLVSTKHLPTLGTEFVSARVFAILLRCLSKVSIVNGAAIAGNPPSASFESK